MDVPGVADAMQDPALQAKAKEEGKKLFEELKKSVTAKITDIGVLRKELRVTVPQKVIGEFLTRNFDDIMHDVVVPGFRKGRAPRRLVEKRYGSEVRDSLKTTVLGQSYFAVIEKEKLDVLGDPLVQIQTGEQLKLVSPDEALEHIRLPDTDDFEYVCEVEIKPTFELPELKGIELEKPIVTITDEDIENTILRQRKIRGRFELVTDGAAEAGDMVIADVTLHCGDENVKHEENVQLGVRAQRLDGIPLPDLGDTLTGIKVGETRKAACTISDDYERSDLRGKEGEFEIVAHEIKRLAPIDIEAIVSQSGCDSEQELRDNLREDMEAELDKTIKDGLNNQILAYLLENTKLDLPEKLSARQTDRAIMRKVVELQREGMPQSDIEARIDELRTVAAGEASTQLKLQFILDKTAEELEVTASDEEVNSAIAMIARRYNRRFDRVRDELQQQGTLAQLADQIRHDKCIASLLKDAKIAEKAIEKPTGEGKKEKAAAPKKTAEKAAEKAVKKKAVPAAAKPAAKTTTKAARKTTTKTVKKAVKNTAKKTPKK